MPKKIHKRNQKVPAIPLPFLPTETPDHGQVAIASKLLLLTVQTLFRGNPAATLTSLKAAENAYAKSLGSCNIMEQDEIEEYQALGMKLADILLADADSEKDKQDKQVDGEDSGIVVPDSPAILGLDGNPIVSGK